MGGWLGLYFIDYHLNKIEQALTEFKEYLSQEKEKSVNLNKIRRMKHNFNDRQIKLLMFLFDDPKKRSSIKTHMSVFQVANKTAIKDLKELLAQGFLESNKEGRTIYYYLSKKTKKLFT